MSHHKPDRRISMNRKNAAYILNVIFISLLLILFLIGCERFNSDDYHDNAIDEHDASMSASTTEESPSNDKPDDIPEQNGNENTDPTHEEVLDYSQMSNEEIIALFMKAWEEQNTEVMDDLSNLSKLYANGFNFQKYGYNMLFCWAAGISTGLNGRPESVCTHGCENFSHKIYNLNIRQSYFGDYGIEPDRLESKYKHYKDVYFVSFTMDENNIINHLEVCTDSAPKDQNKTEFCIFFRMINDKEKGHRVIANKDWLAERLGR